MNKADVMTLAEVAELTRQPEATLRWRRAKGLPPLSARLGRRVVYRRRDVEAWIEEAFANGRGEQ